MDRVRRGKHLLETELRRLARKLAEGHDSPPMMGELTALETELTEIANKLLSEGPGSVEADVEDIRLYVTGQLADLRTVLDQDVAPARGELAKRSKEIRMMPQQAEGERFYVAVGERNLLGGVPVQRK